jgi:hypothetical protein
VWRSNFFCNLGIKVWTLSFLSLEFHKCIAKLSSRGNVGNFDSPLGYVIGLYPYFFNHKNLHLIILFVESEWIYRFGQFENILYNAFHNAHYLYRNPLFLKHVLKIWNLIMLSIDPGTVTRGDLRCDESITKSREM